MNYYNDNDKGAVKWIKYLIRKNLIPKGEIDDRDIREIEPRELNGFTQCHFFAGIGGWSYALQLAGWPADRPVWTGSCPCQPFSVAGQGRGIDDERHLWPAFRWLIAQCRPATVFGEQVASRDGREWLAGVRSDMEAMGYAVGAADLCAASVGAPHIRQRLWWVADAEHSKRRQETTTGNNDNGKDTGRQETAGGFVSCRAVDNGVADAPGKRQHGAAGMSEQNRRAGWATPRARDYKSEKGTEKLYQKRLSRTKGESLSFQVTTIQTHGGIMSQQIAGTANGGVSLKLNPRFPLWLMGYPAEWLYSEG